MEIWTPMTIRAITRAMYPSESAHHGTLIDKATCKNSAVSPPMSRKVAPASTIMAP
jgi:hypothetical protein